MNHWWVETFQILSLKGTIRRNQVIAFKVSLNGSLPWWDFTYWPYFLKITSKRLFVFSKCVHKVMTLRICHTFPFKLDLGIRKKQFSKLENVQFQLLFPDWTFFRKTNLHFYSIQKTFQTRTQLDRVVSFFRLQTNSWANPIKEILSSKIPIFLPVALL